MTTSTPAPTPSLIPQPANVPAVSFARADLAHGSSSGVTGTGPLTLAASGLAMGTYDDPYGQSGIGYQSGTWTSDWIPVAFPFDDLVASWNADTPASTWIRMEMQARGAGRETKFYTMMTWASGDTDIHRTSMSGQQSADGDVNVDTFKRAAGAAPLDSYRLRVTLYQRSGSTATPSVQMLTAMVSTPFKYEIPSPFAGTAIDLQVPALSQEDHKGEFPEYDGGGEAWCSPTSTAMVLGALGASPSDDELEKFPGSNYGDPQVDFAARYTYDWNYKGTGNWPANVAYATHFGLEGFVTRLRSLSEAELFIAASIPLIASINGDLPGFLFGKTNGHLLVIRGFDKNGDVIVNDPAAKTSDDVRKIYGRADFERVWLGGSGGIVYVIYPRGKTLPPNVPGLPANW
ncbi:MAG TPA: C39 family peptidase [Candidatus Limnocylindria bacterium]